MSIHTGNVNAMGISLVPVKQKAVIEHLMQFYLYDFTQFLDIDVNDEGRFAPYPGLDDYWIKRETCYPYMITYHNKPVGFALVDRMDDPAEADFYLCEFFVMKKYRRSGLGTWAAHQLFDRLRGRWKVTQISTNTPAQAFWRKTIGAYTGNRYEERVDPERGNPSQYFSSEINSLR
ncbi:GNAT family N-acetyltransferase [Paenibacillus sp. N3/727]|uniref:GNAT family N-acetyltransferase n=1 Tax=Paenibacillus sp. N3/727 TaxID=2925845 RepID=UPI001F539799|nr:GNAT family N-acetyltransferase [Paenibacillus sp. N3/727]UNK20900.1 GNAT family N-acetyltransferase [Paenibacillus sp. N3/727]